MAYNLKLLRQIVQSFSGQHQGHMEAAWDNINISPNIPVAFIVVTFKYVRMHSKKNYSTHFGNLPGHRGGGEIATWTKGCKGS